MNRAEHLSPLAGDDPVSLEPANSDNNNSELAEAVTRAVRDYLAQLDGQMTTDFYQLVLAEIEAPLLREIMTYTRHNQTRASIMLGLNRGTLRKKLKQYDLLSNKD
ncbi:DNA-binding transcriptional regulator Fis [Parahaliea mediterranea]|uniref:DNA-binding transcriptional regulator Fis n=1 Tax=Parahaliea mediterranea TaxID=651086 RepID=UPI000E2F97FB|nr:DNA-binding transcriptional regulator Fis [Parahaliea mediterranea]